MVTVIGLQWGSEYRTCLVILNTRPKKHLKTRLSDTVFDLCPEYKAENHLKTGQSDPVFGSWLKNGTKTA